MHYGDTILYKEKQYIVIHIYENGFVEIGIPNYDEWLSVGTSSTSRLSVSVRGKENRKTL